MVFQYCEVGLRNNLNKFCIKYKVFACQKVISIHYNGFFFDFNYFNGNRLAILILKIQFHANFDAHSLRNI
jgi:hypothetical protein